ncbi:MAG: BLUF domain-containing protein [Ramlibacter sp.]
MSAAGEVARVILVSVSRVQGSVMQQLLQERNIISARGNEPGVRTALLHCSGWFVLWLEGEEMAIGKVVQRYLRDPRHAHQRELHRSHGTATLLEPMTVAATQGADTPADFARRIYRIKKDQDQSPAGPAAIWEQLSAPCGLPFDAAVRPRVAGHMALVASDDPGSIEILRKLGERCLRRVVYQRFATGEQHSPDVGGAYVDIGPWTGVTRVQLLSRRALAHRMVRQSLARLQSLTLLLGSRPRAAVELAASVAAFMEAAALRPAIQLVTQCPEIASRVGELLVQGQQHAAPCAVVPVAENRLVDYLQELLRSGPECPAQAA